jgi:kynurenine 3-monooxygenase
VIGADGVFSAVRRALIEATNGAERLEELEIGYKQLSIEPGAGGASPLRKDVHHVWPRSGFVMTGLPNPDGSFTATLFGARRSLEALRTDARVRSFFQEHFADVLPRMPRLEREYAGRSTNPLVTLGCSPWHGGRAVLVGDACHTFMPFSGQGANAALADCEALAACIEEYAPELEAGLPEMGSALEAYEESRKPEAEAIAHLSNVMTPLVLWLADPLTAPTETP